MGLLYLLYSRRRLQSVVIIRDVQYACLEFTSPAIRTGSLPSRKADRPVSIRGQEG
jgi:hypothetical protein